VRFHWLLAEAEENENNGKSEYFIKDRLRATGIIWKKRQKLMGVDRGWI